MATPYISAAMLQAAPAGLSWQVVPTLTADTITQGGQLAAVCLTASSQADTYLRQPLRATLVTETLHGPGMPRVSISRDTGIATLITRQQPVLSVAAVQVSQAISFPPVQTLVQAGQYRARNPVLMPPAGIPVPGPSGGNAIDVAPQTITWDHSRGGFDILVSYISGYPPTSLTEAVLAGVSTVDVDDVTGWAGWTGFAWDSPMAEDVTVSSVTATSPVQLPGIAGTVAAGPGTLTLSAPLAWGHDAGTVISAVPGSALHGVALLAAVQALETIDAIAVQSLSGQSASVGALAEQAELMLDDFRRVA